MNPTPRTAAALCASLLAGGAGLCHAQTSVTISGFFKSSIDYTKLRNTAKNPNAQSRVTDDGSRIVFQAVEDLGDGMRAFARSEWVVRLDGGTIDASSPTLLGLRKPSWGRLWIGSYYRHFYHRESQLTEKAGSQKADSMSLLSYARGGFVPIAVASVMPNIISYQTPNWDGFTLDTTWSSSPFAAQDGDIGSRTRKGRGWNLNPNYRGKNLQVGYSYWDARADGAVIGDQRGDRLYGSYRWAGLMLGFAWDWSRITNPATHVRLSDRKAWSVPVGYKTGDHNFYVHYTKANDDKATAGVRDGARMWAFAYAYDLSKRTSVGLSHARISNDAGALYNFFGTTGPGGSASAALAAGESPRIWVMTLRHGF